MAGHSRNTLRKLMRAKTAPALQPLSRASKVDLHRDYRTKRWQAQRLSAVRSLAEIKPRGFADAVNLVRPFLVQCQAVNCNAPLLTVRFEALPGEQAQCD